MAIVVEADAERLAKLAWAVCELALGSVATSSAHPLDPVTRLDGAQQHGGAAASGLTHHVGAHVNPMLR